MVSALGNSETYEQAEYQRGVKNHSFHLPIIGREALCLATGLGETGVCVASK